jgi:CRP/FNR family transcriptional regulator
MVVQASCTRCPAHAGGLFCGLSPAKLANLMQERSARDHAIGETIFYEGNAALAVFCVGSGQVKLTRAGPHGDPHVIATRGAGDLLGCRAVLAGGLYTVTAEPLRPSRVCMIPRASFIETVREDAALAFGILTRMARMTIESEDQLMMRSVEHVRQRTARYLLGIAPDCPVAYPLELSGLLPRHEMAQLIGTTTETLSRTLHVLAMRGILEVDRDRIVVKDPEALRRVAR